MGESALGLDRLTFRFWLLGLAQAAHSMEEMRARLYDFFWTATGRMHEIAPSIPQTRMTAQTFALLNMSFITILLGAVPFVRARKAPAIFFAGLAGVIEVLNGIGHTAGAIWFRGYVPGVATAPLLFVTGVLVLTELWRAPRETPLTPTLSPQAGRGSKAVLSAGGERE
ncbi:MAG TPA: HXXEE domain-containing protein [Thermoanaerobaculia bacterium]|nr:HXXEE domain-containing protein [Thermoanaerobaculia bacterium]